MLLGSSEQRLGILLNILQRTRQFPEQRLIRHTMSRVQRRQNSAPRSQKKLILVGTKGSRSPHPVSEQSLASMPQPNPTPSQETGYSHSTKLTGNRKCQGQAPKRRRRGGKQEKGQALLAWGWEGESFMACSVQSFN